MAEASVRLPEIAVEPPPSKAVDEPEVRVEPGTNTSVVGDNGNAQALTGATAQQEPFNPYARRPGESKEDYWRRLQDAINDKPQSKAEAPAYLEKLQNIQNGILGDPDYNAWRQNLNPSAFSDPVGNGGTSPTDPFAGYTRIPGNGDRFDQWIPVGGGLYQGMAADGLVYDFPPSQVGAGQGPLGLGGAIAQQYDRVASVVPSAPPLQGEIGPKIGSAVGSELNDPSRLAAGLKSPRLTGGRPKPEPKPEPKPPEARKGTGTTVKGEPVSVTNGEYLETWEDFDIPGTLAFDGSRYMGLKLGLPASYESPLGPCQISAFDEIISNPEPGRLLYHDARGQKIGFERPFNFLASTNAAFPHLKLKAPWLKRLTLRDKRLVKEFSQYPDRVYRLMSVETLDGHRMSFHRRKDGAVTRIDGPDGLSLVFENDAAGRRVGIRLIGTDGSALDLARYAYDAGGRMAQAECAFGMSVSYEWAKDAPLLLSWHNRTRRSETRFSYDEAGRVVHTATTGIWNNDRFRYDAEARRTHYLPGGDASRVQSFQYDADENVTEEVDALGHVTRHVYSEARLRTATTDANGNTSRTTYDRDGNVKRFTDAEGRETIYGWSPTGALDIVIDGIGATREFENDEAGNVVTVTDAEGHETRIERDDTGRIVAIRFPDGSLERRAYDRWNRLTEIVDAAGGTTHLSYDVFGRLVSAVDAMGGETRFSYAAGAGGFATPTGLVRPDGVEVSRDYDAEGTLAAVTDGEGRRWTYRHGAFGVLEAISDPSGGTLAFAYDGEGRIVSVKNATGRLWRFERDVAGRVVAEEDFDGTRTLYRRDAGGRVVEAVKADGARLRYGYDRTDRITLIEAYGPGAFPTGPSLDGNSVDPTKTKPTLPPEDVTRFTYDGRGLLAGAENKTSKLVYERDRNGRVTAEIANGRRIESRHDPLGNRVERRIGGHLVKIHRDPLGLVERLVIGDHAPLSFARDALGRETARASASGFRLDQAYDAVGQLLRQAAGSRGGSVPFVPHLHPGTDRGAPGLSALDGFGAGGAGAATFGPGPELDRSFTWTKALEPSRITDARWGTSGFDYDRNGQIGRTHHGDGSEERFLYDPAHDVAGFGEGTGAQGLGLRGTGAVAGAAGGGRLSPWRLSAGGRVAEAFGPAGERVELVHDACGRVVSRRVERAGFRPRVWRFVWDAQDRLAEVLTPEEERWVYAYDPFGRRVSKRLVVPTMHGEFMLARAAKAGRLAKLSDGRIASGTAYLWDGDVVAEEAPLLDDDTIALAEATRWHYEPETFRPLAKEASDGSLFFVVTDHLGTPREMFDEAGRLAWAAEYRTWGALRRLWRADNDNPGRPAPGGASRSPGAGRSDWSGGSAGSAGQGLRGGRLFTAGALALAGELNAEDGPAALAAAQTCPIRFQGQWQDDETGLFYNRHRYYDPLTAQYMSPDPIGLEGGARPQGYVENPAGWVDPFGLAAKLRNLDDAKNDEGEYLYRGVHSLHPELENAKRGIINPGDPNGAVTPDMHNAGGYSASSPYTSWSRNPEKARAFANEHGPGGVVVRVPTGAPSAGSGWGWEWSPDRFFEDEVLLRGSRSGGEVFEPWR